MTAITHPLLFGNSIIPSANTRGPALLGLRAAPVGRSGTCRYAPIMHTVHNGQRRKTAQLPARESFTAKNAPGKICVHYACIDFSSAAVGCPALPKFPWPHLLPAPVPGTRSLPDFLAGRLMRSIFSLWSSWLIRWRHSFTSQRPTLYGP